jgi:hypothetical protein
MAYHRAYNHIDITGGLFRRTARYSSTATTTFIVGAAFIWLKTRSRALAYRRPNECGGLTVQTRLLPFLFSTSQPRAWIPSPATHFGAR